MRAAAGLEQGWTADPGAAASQRPGRGRPGTAPGRLGGASELACNNERSRDEGAPSARGTPLRPAAAQTLFEVPLVAGARATRAGPGAAGLRARGGAGPGPPYRSGRRRERRPKVSWLTWPLERKMHLRAAVSVSATAAAARPTATSRGRHRRASWSPLSRISGSSSPPPVSYSQTHTVRCIPSARARRREPPALLAAAVLLFLGRPQHPPARAHASPSPARRWPPRFPHIGRGGAGCAASADWLGSLLQGPRTRAPAHTRPAPAHRAAEKGSPAPAPSATGQAPPPDSPTPPQAAPHTPAHTPPRPSRPRESLPPTPPPQHAPQSSAWPPLHSPENSAASARPWPPPPAICTVPLLTAFSPPRPRPPLQHPSPSLQRNLPLLPSHRNHCRDPPSPCERTPNQICIFSFPNLMAAHRQYCPPSPPSGSQWLKHLLSPADQVNNLVVPGVTSVRKVQPSGGPRLSLGTPSVGQGGGCPPTSTSTTQSLPDLLTPSDRSPVSRTRGCREARVDGCRGSSWLWVARQK